MPFLRSWNLPPRTGAHFCLECRLQLQGELQAKADQAKRYKGVLHGVKVILQNEGPRGLFRGIGSAVCDMNYV